MEVPKANSLFSSSSSQELGASWLQQFAQHELSASLIHAGHSSSAEQPEPPRLSFWALRIYYNHEQISV